MLTENNMNISSLNTNGAITVLEAMVDWNNYGNETGFFTEHNMKNSPYQMESDKDY